MYMSLVLSCFHYYAFIFSRCHRDTIVTGSKEWSQLRGVDSCPRISWPVKEMVIPAKARFPIKVKGVNLQSFQNNFQCEFKFGPGDIRKIPAIYNGVRVMLLLVMLLFGAVPHSLYRRVGKLVFIDNVFDTLLKIDEIFLKTNRTA